MYTVEDQRVLTSCKSWRSRSYFSETSEKCWQQSDEAHTYYIAISFNLKSWQIMHTAWSSAQRVLIGSVGSPVVEPYSDLARAVITALQARLTMWGKHLRSINLLNILAKLTMILLDAVFSVVKWDPTCTKFTFKGNHESVIVRCII